MLYAEVHGIQAHYYSLKWVAYSGFFFLPVPQNCASGFLSLNILRSLLMNIRAYPPSGQYIIPAFNLSLMCTRESVMQVKGILVGELKDTDEQSRQPSLQITWWRPNGTQTYNLTAAINLTTMHMDGHPNTYFFESSVSDGLNVMMGDVLGIRLTENFRLYYDSNRRRIINRQIGVAGDFIDQVRIPVSSNRLIRRESDILGAPLLSSNETGSCKLIMITLVPRPSHVTRENIEKTWEGLGTRLIMIAKLIRIMSLHILTLIQVHYLAKAALNICQQQWIYI